MTEETTEFEFELEASNQQTLDETLLRFGKEVTGLDVARNLFNEEKARYEQIRRKFGVVVSRLDKDRYVFGPLLDVVEEFVPATATIRELTVMRDVYSSGSAFLICHGDELGRRLL